MAKSVNDPAALQAVKEEDLKCLHALMEGLDFQYVGGEGYLLTSEDGHAAFAMDEKGRTIRIRVGDKRRWFNLSVLVSLALSSLPLIDKTEDVTP